eukprot:CAMPEP_0179492662 /NCGR_PEP_ID=MMETSP0799-20121207/66914_1 /TAXON_ID=46947 /ORGANISM="Geminigera cryophila, Strain CCMP2564" /LENGTH=83 /DNA_ID=CAMNT_0021309541 /DNA_START=1 /DNA_END=248 /DNA_ORIENTATION=+
MQAELDQRFVGAADRERKLREDIQASRRMLHEERRRWEDRNFEAEQLAEQLAGISMTSSKRSDEVAQLQENLTTTSDALMHTG